MSLSLLTEPPEAPAHAVPWEALQVFPWVRALAGCPQDPVHHAEGNVWIHTRMVLETLVSLPAWRALPREDRAAVYLACLLHDVAKPTTTRAEEDGRVTARGHSRAGELFARRILWELGAPFALREMVCGLVRYHQVPFFLIESQDPRRAAAELSYACRADLLALVAEADARGRVCRDAARMVENVELFRLFCAENDCLDRPWAFPSDHARVVYFRTPGRSLDAPAFDDTRGEMVLLSGLPGAGKDTFVRAEFPGLPVVSLDALRLELGVEPGDEQGSVVQAARERAREYLRRGERFVFNATNLNRQRRDPLVQLTADYGARVSIVYLEAPRARLLADNRARAARVPESVIQRMTERWEVPRWTEAHALRVVLRSDEEPGR